MKRWPSSENSCSNENLINHMLAVEAAMRA